MKEDHVPTFLQDKVELIDSGRCIDYLQAAQSADAGWSIHEVFPEHYWHKDFDEVPISADTWQPQIDSLQSQIADIVNVYSTDDERIQYLAQQLATGGLIFDQVDAKVLAEEQRALAAEGGLSTDVSAEETRAKAAELAIEQFFEGTNTNHDDDRAQIKLDFAQGDVTGLAATSSEESRALGVEGTLSTEIAAEEARAKAAEAAIELFFEGTDATAEADRLDIRADYIAADVVVNQAVVDEASLARQKEAVLTSAVATEEARALAAESANDGKIEVEKARVTAILNLSVIELDSFKEIADAYANADQNVEDTVTNLVNARVLITTYDTDQGAQDTAIGLNSDKRTYSTAEEAKVAVNDLKRTYSTAEEAKVAANELKRTYSTAEEAKVAANELKRTYSVAEEAKVAVNELKRT
ncbi:TPA: hypothetical protein EYO63_17450, partial [Candidatus Poribacteria bacterium]|nr:hypothetical protein [Candidatus Poribacteria bacterium]